MTGSEAAKVVRTVLCKGLSSEQSEQIVKAMVAVKAEPGHVLFHEGDHAQGLFVLVKGTVEILKHEGRGGARQSIATVDAPAVIGEMSLLTEREHSASVRAKTACHFRLLTRSQFDRLLKAENLAAYKIVRTLAEVVARRLYLMDEKVLELSRQPRRVTPVEELTAFRDKLFSEWSF